MSSMPSEDPSPSLAVIPTPEEAAAPRRIAEQDRRRPLLDFAQLVPPFPRSHFRLPKTAEGHEPFRLDPVPPLR